MNIKEAICVKYFYSACILTKTQDVVILHDPWFTDGIYDGSWYQFPKIKNPIDMIGDIDYIYISHIHPDHYDPLFLKKYFEVYGEKKIIIGNHNPNYLEKKMIIDGFKPIILNEPIKINKTEIQILPHTTGCKSDIDSVILIKYFGLNSTHCVVNANDVIFDEYMIKKIKSNTSEIDIFLSGFTGAGSYPQTYFDINDIELKYEAENKKSIFFGRYMDVVKKINAKVNIPFAGKYLLGGKLSELNPYRGVADPVEVLEFDKNAIVLSDNGGEIYTKNKNKLDKKNIRINKYNKNDIQNRILEIKKIKMNYEKLISKSEINKLPLVKLLKKAELNAKKHSQCIGDYYFIFYLPENIILVINANKNSPVTNAYYSKENLPLPRSEIYIDPRYLFGLITSIYHWNNAEIGSQYFTRRFPNKFNKNAQDFLNFLVI